MSVASAAAEAVTGSATTAASKEVGAAAAKAADNWFSKGIGWVGNNPGRAAAYGGVGAVGAYGLSYVNPMLDKRDRGTIAGGFKTALGVGALAGAGFGAHYLWKGKGASTAEKVNANLAIFDQAARDVGPFAASRIYLDAKTGFITGKEGANWHGHNMFDPVLPVDRLTKQEHEQIMLGRAYESNRQREILGPPPNPLNPQLQLPLAMPRPASNYQPPPSPSPQLSLPMPIRPRPKPNITPLPSVAPLPSPSTNSAITPPGGILGEIKRRGRAAWAARTGYPEEMFDLRNV